MCGVKGSSLHADQEGVGQVGCSQLINVPLWVPPLIPVIDRTACHVTIYICFGLAFRTQYFSSITILLIAFTKTVSETYQTPLQHLLT